MALTPEIRPAAVIVKFLVIVVFEITRVKLRAGLYLILRQVQVDVGISPVHVSNPLRRNQDFLAGPQVRVSTTI